MKNRGYDIDWNFANMVTRYAVTTIGEVICLSDYCCRLANKENVHVVLLEDTTDTRRIEEEKFLHPSVRGKDSFNELKQQSRQGLARFHYFFWCNVKDVFEFVTHKRKALDQRTFIFPLFLKAHTHHCTFNNVSEQEEMLIDLRDAADISDL